MSENSLHPEELLPWYVNNTLSGDEREHVEQHLTSCTHCQQQVALLRAIQENIKQPLTMYTPGELGLRRLLRDVKKDSRKPRAWLPFALAASVAVVAIQTAVLVSVLIPQEPHIVPLGAHSVSDMAQLQVRFVPSASEAEIRAALNEIDGIIVDGPGALGIYHVRLAAVRADQSALIETVVQRLRAHTRVVQQVTIE